MKTTITHPSSGNVHFQLEILNSTSHDQPSTNPTQTYRWRDGCCGQWDSRAHRKKGPRRPPFTHERFPERHGSSITAISQSPFVLLPLLLPFGCIVSLESALAANPTPPSCRFPEVELVFHFKLNELALHYCVEMLPAWIRCRREVRYSDRLIFLK